MKISSIGTLTLGAIALAAGSAFANVTPNLQDSQGAAVKDGQGACVVTSGQILPECAGAKPPPAPNVIVPRHRGDTRRPERPSKR